MQQRKWIIGMAGMACAALGASSALAQSVAQGPITNPANGHVYYRLTNSTWTQARAAALALGGDLATINDAAENTFVLNTFANDPGAGRVWLGYNDAAASGTFVWANGETPAFTNWDGGEPNNIGTEHWVLMYSGNGRWNNVPDQANPFGIGNVYGVVEVVPPTVTSGPITNPANGHCYYLFSNSNWDAARAAAIALGGDLVTINDAAENTFVQTNFAAAPGIGRVWIGYNDPTGVNAFVWANGEAPGFTNWEVGEPNNIGTERWAHMYGNSGRWNNAINQPNPFGIGAIYGVAEVTCGPVNDSCASAVNVSAGGDFSGTLVNAHFTVSDGGASCGDAGVNADVWYVFTAPGCNGRITASTCGTNDTGGLDAGLDTVLSFRGSCGGPELDCNDDGVGDPCGNADNGLIRDSFLTRELTAGQVVYIRVSPFSGTAGRPFTLHVAFAASNDECASPLAISVGATTVCDTIATTSTPTTETGCAVPTRTMNKDLWYRYVPHSSGVFTVTTCDPATNFDTILAAYSACPAAAGAALTCNDDSGCNTSGLGSTIRVTGVANQAYLIRLASFNTAGGTAVITIYCPGDFNQNGVISVQDIFDFLSAYFAGNTRADINGSGAISVQDIFDFLSAYFSGC